MEVVYTPEKLRDGYIIEGESSSKRTPLDLERYELIKSKYREATISKFKLTNEIKFGNEIKKIACRKCRDTENKLKKH